MRAKNAGGAIALCLLTAGLLRADSNAPEVVTNPTPALSATMTLSADANGCFTWTVQGKVKPAFRGHGATVKLVCTPYNSLSQGCAGRVFPECDGDCPPNVDACGNFSFQILTCGPEAQLDNSNFCRFVVHVDDSKSPQSCGKTSTNSGSPVQDPNGSAPCSGGYCPSAP